MTDKPVSDKNKKRGPARSEGRQVAEDLGISRTLAWQWKMLATIPEGEFEELIASPGKPNTARFVEHARRRVGMAPARAPAPRHRACPHCGGDLSLTEEARP